MKILLIGPQGSGKSTQGKLLSEYLNVPFISTGDIFRSIALGDTEEGKRIKQILNAGKLVDDETVVRLVKERISVSDCNEGFILDGTPRTVEQAENLEINFDKAVYLKLPKDIVLQRLLKRGREDDKEDLIKNRLDLYYKQTQPLLDYYKNQGVLIEIDGIGDIQTVQDEIKKSL